MPNSRQVSPDVAEEERDAGRQNNNNMEHDVAVGHAQHKPGGVGGVVRRDENSKSFRHFLQPHSDVVPAPAPTCRGRSRGSGQPGAVDLVDMAMALPDFVQDHLVVESLAHGEHQNNGGAHPGGGNGVDLNVLNEILPDFANQPAHALPAHSRRRNIPEEPAVVPEVHRGAAGGSSALPDFLSDGPMQCTDTPPALPTSRSGSRIVGSISLTERNRVDESSRSTSFDSSESMRSEVERLRRDLADRNRRISQLEAEIVRLRTNVSALESGLRAAEQSALRADIPNSGGDAAAASSSSAVRVNGSIAEYGEVDAQAVQEIAQSSEALLSQLLLNMSRLKEISKSPSQKVEDPTQDSSDNDEGEAKLKK